MVHVLEKTTNKNEAVELKIISLLKLKKFASAQSIIDQAIDSNIKVIDWEKILVHLIDLIEITHKEIKFEEALVMIKKGEEILQQAEKHSLELIDKKGRLLFLKGLMVFRLEKTKEAIKYLHKSIDYAEKHSLYDIKYQAMHRVSVGYVYLGEHDVFLNLASQALQYFRVKENKSMVIDIIHNFATVYATIGDYKKAREYWEQKMEIEGETPRNIGSIGDTYWREGELEKGLELMETSLEKIRATTENADEDPIFLFNIANLNSRKGNHNLALEKYQKTISAIGSAPRYALIGYSHIGISNVYYHRGELNTAMIHGEKALKIFERFEGKYGMGWAYFVLSKIYYEMANVEKTLYHLQASLDLRMIIGNKLDISLTIRDLITYMLENESLDEIDDYFNQLKKIATTNDNKIVKQNYLLTEALILKSKGRPKYWTQAIDILEEIVTDSIADYNTMLVALINLCELLLSEFSISGNDEVLSDLVTHTSRLLDIAQRQNSYTLRVEAYHIRIITLWLQAQHSKADINIQNARRLLHEARDLADSHGLIKLSSKINSQNEKMLDQLENWDNFIRKYYEFIKSD